MVLLQAWTRFGMHGRWARWEQSSDPALEAYRYILLVFCKDIPFKFLNLFFPAVVLENIVTCCILCAGLRRGGGVQ
jgi:hypothetical protein